MDINRTVTITLSVEQAERISKQLSAASMEFGLAIGHTHPLVMAIDEPASIFQEAIKNESLLTVATCDN